MDCRFCSNKLSNIFIDLVNSPPSNSFLSKEQLDEPEAYFPLKIFICEKCFLVQIDEYKKSNEIFSDEYVYFSSYSKSWLEHSKRYCDLMIEKYGVNSSSKVIEIASNDGYMLQYFKEKNIPVLGIEPTEGTAKIAIDKGIETITDFFGEKLAKELASRGRKADLLLGNNVLAHVPDINDFVKGLKALLNNTGIITMEFPHLMQLIENNQFDTIYHEHFSYLSFMTIKMIFEANGLEMFNVEELPTHGGSLRIFAKHKEDSTNTITSSVNNLIEKEEKAGMNKVDYYTSFQEKADKVKYALIEFLIGQKRKKKTVVGYGAAAKGNTLLNYCGVKKDLIDYVVDISPHKQNKFLPGSHIPVFSEDKIKRTKPDFIIILPWNLKDEIINQLFYIKEWDAKFVIPIPGLEIIK